MAEQSSTRDWGLATFLCLFTLVVCPASFVSLYRGCSARSRIQILVSLVFATAGLMLAPLTVNRVLNLFNPTIRVSFTPDQSAPGSELTIGWSLGRKARKIDVLHIALEGYEWVKYAHGTDTKVEVNVFDSLPVHRIVDPSTMRSGVVRFTLPRRTIPSLSTSQSAIRWRVHFLGEMRHWPDFDARFDLAVVAAKPLAARPSDLGLRG